MECRCCGTCCVEISISSPLPGMSKGKPAGERCVNLNNNCRCKVHSDKPNVCKNFKPTKEFCGNNKREAIYNIRRIERETKPLIAVNHN